MTLDAIPLPRVTDRSGASFSDAEQVPELKSGLCYVVARGPRFFSFFSFFWVIFLTAIFPNHEGCC